MNKSVVWTGLFLLAGQVGGCGYHGQVGLPNELKRIHLTMNSSGIFRPGLQTAFAQALTQRILGAGGEIVAEKSQADAWMTATITALENNPVAFDAKDIAQRFRVAVVVDLQVIRRDGKVELVKEPVRGEAYYSAPGGITGTEVAQNEAISRAIRDLADKVVTRVVEPF